MLGVTGQYVRYVLAFGLAGVIIAFLVIACGVLPDASLALCDVRTG